MLRDTWVLFRHGVGVTLRQKVGVVFGAVQPLLFLVLFGPIFTTFGTWETLVPGLIIQLGLMSMGLAGFGIVFEKRSGVLERMRVTPASRLALLLGRVLTNAVTLILQTLLLLAVAFAFGLRAPALGLVAGFVLVVVLGLSLAALSYAVALTMNEQLFAPVTSTAVIPLILLSGSFLPMSMAPGWLDALSHVSPFRYVLEALRDLFHGHYLDGHGRRRRGGDRGLRRGQPHHRDARGQQGKRVRSAGVAGRRSGHAPGQAALLARR